MGIVVTLYLLIRIQFEELDRQLSKAGIKPDIRHVLFALSRPAAGFISGFLVIFCINGLADYISLILHRI